MKITDSLGAVETGHALSLRGSIIERRFDHQYWHRANINGVKKQ
jgi:hypothetical protein